MKKMKRIKNVAASYEVQKGATFADNTLTFNSALKLGDLATTLGVQNTKIIKLLFNKGQMVNVNETLEVETIGEICLELGIDFNYVESSGSDDDFDFDAIIDDAKDLKERPPVVTVMGHVDHGKTTLIDSIRESTIVKGEAGSITQNIGAYQKELHGKKITFIDTPGHEAFTAMRSRGTRVTDIVILVVAADDGVMPQTREAIDHARAAEVPIIVAVNKIDKYEADPEKVKSELLAENIIAEQYGGDVIFQEISAKTGQGIDDLLEAIIATSEMLELSANPSRYAYGTVLEAKLEHGEGPKATLLIKNGTLLDRDFIVAGASYGKIRRMTNEHGVALKKALPASPVSIIGLDEVPEAGDSFIAFATEKEAKDLALKRKEARLIERRGSSEGFKLSDITEKVAQGEIVTVNAIIKADNSGSAEAVHSSLEKINVEGVKINVIRASAGQITESDILLASASNAVIYGFNVRPNARVRDLAVRNNIELHLHRVIYALIEETEKAIKGLLKPDIVEKVTGQAEVRAIWHVSYLGTIAGCYVLEGVVKRDQRARLIRDGIVVYEGKINTMKHVKNDVRESRAGFECGMTLLNYNDIKNGDIIEGYDLVEVPRE
ncbi:MAG TPA: translation initiation factor IF-2 [Bacilli bacterium]|nr:translation initiation factor IF-2 [Bacilli bacterium]